MSFYLQDSRDLVGDNIMWWAAGGNGYTSDLRKAQVYSGEEAQKQHNSRHTDIPWPAEHVAKRAYIAVDMQYLGAPFQAPGEGYAQLPGTWVGNDCLWLTEQGIVTTDLSLAAVFSKAPQGYVLWPKGHIDAIARPAVRARDVKWREALAGHDITIQKPAKPCVERLRCCQCNRFLSEAEFWSGACPNCGTDSRP